MRTQRLPVLLILAGITSLVGLGRSHAAIDVAAAMTMDPMQEAAQRSDNYREGQRALDSQRWSEAADRFAAAAVEDAGDADAALYWQAYALLELNRASRAQLVLEELQERFPESRWIDDARALELEAQHMERRAPAPETVTDDELQLIALNSLMHVEWQRARPLLERFLRPGSSPKMAGRALFVLSQSDSAEARQMLLEFATEPVTPELGGEAIHYLAFYGDDRARADIARIYGETPHAEIKARALEAMMIAEDLSTLFRIARDEPDEKLRRTAIEQLGVLEAKDELRRIYASESSPRVRRQILEAFMLADDQETLLNLARTETDEKVRASAIEQLGLMEATTELHEIYADERSPDIRREIAQALMYADDTEFLVRIARTDADPGVRRQAIESIGLIDSPASEQALGELYRSASDAATRHAVIDSLVYLDDPAALIQIARTETDPELRKRATEMLATLDSEAATEFLLELLESAPD